MKQINLKPWGQPADPLFTEGALAELAARGASAELQCSLGSGLLSVANNRREEFDPALQQGIERARDRSSVACFLGCSGSKTGGFNKLDFGIFSHFVPVWISDGSQGSGALCSPQSVCVRMHVSNRGVIPPLYPCPGGTDWSARWRFLLTGCGGKYKQWHVSFCIPRGAGHKACHLSRIQQDSLYSTLSHFSTKHPMQKTFALNFHFYLKGDFFFIIIIFPLYQFFGDLFALLPKLYCPPPPSVVYTLLLFLHSTGISQPTPASF